MPRRLGPVLRAVAAAASTATLSVAGAVPADAAMPSTSGLGTRAGVTVVDLRTGRTLLDRRGATPRIPASVTKVFVVAAALDRLGPEWAPRTRVEATGELVGDAWRGDLRLVGGGDPTLSRAALSTLAGRTVQALGARRLDGRLSYDATAFDDWLGGARTGRAPDGDMGGRLGALTVDRAGGVAVPGLRSASLFRTALRSAGLQVTGAIGVAGRAADASTVATQAGPPLARLAAGILGPSDNYAAEMLVKGLASRDAADATCRIQAGLTSVPADPPLPETPADVACREGARSTAPATTAAGTSVVRRTLRPLIGTTPRIHDGSGLSRQNRVSPRTVVRLLQTAHADPSLGPVLRASLPQAGRTGTLARRMRRTAAVGRCQAKTGTLIGVSALAGYCRTARGRDVAFAILQNTGNTYSARAFQDRFVARLAARG